MNTPGVDLLSGEMKDLGLKGWGARWVPTGHVVYAGIDASLMAVPFDPTELRPRGTPVALAPDTALARNNAPAFAFSHTGTLVRATGYLKGSRREPMHAVAGRIGSWIGGGAPTGDGDSSVQLLSRGSSGEREQSEPLGRAGWGWFAAAGD